MKISVALCTYNGGNFLREQLDSILSQTHPVDEIVVSDDGSTDNTLAILQEYSQKHPALFVVSVNAVNLKSNANFEYTLKKCTGDFVFLSDQDDIWQGNKVSATLAAFAANPHAEAVFSNGFLIDACGAVVYSPLSLWDCVGFFPENIFSSQDLLRSLVWHNNFLTGATLCLKKEAIQHCLPFQTANKFLHDEWLAVVYSERKTLVVLPNKLIKYRLHSAQQMGVGAIKSPESKMKKNKIRHALALGVQKPKTWVEHKYLLKVYFEQFEKYFSLYAMYESPLFKHFSCELKEKYFVARLAIGKKFPVRYWLMNGLYRLKGKRQMGKHS